VSKPELDNLVKIKRLKAEAPSRAEYARMLDSASKRLVDAQNEDLDADSQFDLAYGAAHRFALAALRREGYRSDNNRLTVFQTLVHTVGTANADLQVFLRAHSERNLAEYEGSHGDRRGSAQGACSLHEGIRVEGWQTGCTGKD
jgi:hypothetical protein